LTTLMAGALTGGFIDFLRLNRMSSGGIPYGMRISATLVASQGKLRLSYAPQLCCRAKRLRRKSFIRGL
jgi:hypothetical protein